MPAVRRVLTVSVVATTVALGLGACSSGSGSPSPTITITETATPTETASPTGTASPTESPTGSTSPSPTGSPSTVTPSPTGSVLGITVSYAPTSAAQDQRVEIVGTTDPSLAGKAVWIVKTNDGAPKVLGTGSSVNAKGVAKTYAQLLRTGVLKLVVPAGLLTAGPYDPATPVLAESAPFTITIG
jgi:hypothetical protein